MKIKSCTSSDLLRLLQLRYFSGIQEVYNFDFSQFQLNTREDTFAIRKWM